MTKRVLLLVPEGSEFEQLPEQSQTAIRLVFGQYVMPMPNTRAVDGFVVCDALSANNYNPDNMAKYGITWEVLGLWELDNTAGTIEELSKFNAEKFTTFLSDVVEYDEEGQELSRERPDFHEPHKWSGWPSCFN